ncbi:MAG: YncE family protein [Kiritimatiellae bacterium]|nr:YncE family protein [Kiritimatiellia bacterium]
MKKIVFGIVLCAAAVASAYIGPEQVTVSPDGKALYVTGASGACALVVDATTGAVLSRMELDGCQPTGVAVNRSNGDIYITASDATGNGRVFRFQRDGKRAAVVKQGHQPMAPLVSADGKRLWVANRFDNSVVALDAATLAVQETYRVSREPVGLALGANGKFLFAANHLPDCPATNAVVAAAVSVIDLSSKAVRTVLLPNGSTGVRGIASTPNGKSVFVTHTFGRYQLPTTQLERGWMNTAGLSVFDGETGNYVNTVLLDDVDLGAANPWGVTVSADEKLLAVNHAGTREVSVIELPALLERLAKAQRNERVTEVTHAATDVPNDLSFLVNIRRRYRLSGDGPRGIAMVGNSVYSAVYFADCISRLDLNEGIPQAKEFLLGPKVDLSKDRVRRGEMLWNDGAMCFQQWQSCASCHPDGRSDSLNWDLLNDGIGNPKRQRA